MGGLGCTSAVPYKHRMRAAPSRESWLQQDRETQRSSSQGHLLFLFLSLQYRREGDLKGCPGTIEREDISGLGSPWEPTPISTCEDTHSHVVQMGLKLQKTVQN